jgi:HlyD family secretion protein
MKKALRIILKILVWCAVIGGLGYGGYRFYLSRQVTPAADSAAATTYTKVQISTGDLGKTVTGTGTLSISKTEDVAVSFPVTVKNVRVTAGEQVHTGDPLMDVDITALKAAIATMETDLATTEDSLTSLARSYEDEAALKLPASARVKKIYGNVGDLTQDVMKEYDALAVLSMDGKMKVAIPKGELTVGAAVTVHDGTVKYDGVVQGIEEDNAVITFADTKTLEGASVEVTKNDVSQGTGEAKINLPFYFTTTTQGRISKVGYAVNTKPNRNAVLFSLTQVPVSSEYDTLMAKRQQTMDSLKAANDVLASGVIPATIDGIVSTVTTASLTDTAANTVLASLYVGDAKQMVISVDELDIINVEVGQSVTIAMDAVTDKKYDATVSHISQIGTTSSGVTTYDVTLDVQGDEQLKIGMNGTATIHVLDVTGAVLVPIAALNTSKEGQYVWLYDESASSESGEPGVKTFVTTGLSSDAYAEVKSGLKAGDYVMITRTANTNTNNRFAGFEGMPAFEGGQMPSFQGGGNGGGTRNSEGGFQRPGN